MRRLLIILLLTLPLRAANVHYLVSTDPAWVTDVWAINRGDTVQTLNVANCGYPEQLTVPAHGFAIRRDLGHGNICASHGYTYVDGGVTSVDVLTIARNVNGMRLFLPGARQTLPAYGSGVSLDVLNYGEDVARIYMFQDGSTPGPVTFIVRDASGREVAREKHDTRLQEIVSFRLETPLPAGGSVLVTPGYRTTGFGVPGANSPSNAPDGATYVFAASGVESGASAPLITAPITTEFVP